MDKFEGIIPVIEDLTKIPKGDMPGDKVQIDSDKLEKAKIIFPKLMELLTPLLKRGKAVVSVYGGSGVGKSEIGSLLAYFLNANEIGTYIMSGDNYPHRIPKLNDAQRLRVYQEYGIEGLTDYLATDKEIDFQKVNRIIEQFKQGKDSIDLKRMGREEEELWYDPINMESIEVLILEWTHGNNPNLKGIDIPIYLNSTPEETREHRRSRNRDGNTDSPFTTMVLEIEQEKLMKQAETAKIIVMKNGEIISYDEYSGRISL